MTKSHCAVSTRALRFLSNNSLTQSVKAMLFLFRNIFIAWCCTLQKKARQVLHTGI